MSFQLLSATQKFLYTILGALQKDVLCMYGARYKHTSNLLTHFGVSVGQSKYCIQIRSLFFQCLVFRVYQFLFLFLCLRLVNVTHSWTPPSLPFTNEGVEQSKFLQKMGADWIFTIKREGLVNWRYHLFSYQLTFSKVIILPVFGALVCFVYLYHFYQYSLCFMGRT